ncbi:hypothetical protein FKM82_020895, partial [Ascaphus truei]
LPALLRIAQPFLLYLESAARGTLHQNGTLPETIQRQLLDVSQQLVSRLEQLSLMYGSFGFISLDETDPGGMACTLCGRFSLGPACLVSIFRYFMPAPYCRTHQALYKRLRWNVEVSEDTDFGRETHTKYYFLCYRDTGLDVSRGMSLPPPGPSEKHRLWSIGLWIPLEPASDTDVLSWVLCPQPSGWYHQLLTVGFHEPSHTAATDFLVQILT